MKRRFPFFLFLLVLIASLTLVGCGGDGGGSSQKAPAAPTGVKATAGDQQATISWTSVTGASSYNIYWATATGVTKTSGTKVSNVTSPYTQTSLTNGTTYYYVVTAVNTNGESAVSSEVSAVPVATNVTGTVAQGLVDGATVNIYALVDGQKQGDPIGTGTTNADGTYSIDIQNYNGPFIVEVSGGQYVDEATGATMDAGSLRAAVPAVTGTPMIVAVTPLTELAVRKAGTVLAKDNITAANAMISQMLGTNGDILTDQPFDVRDSTAGESATDTQKAYTLILAALSQMSADTGQSQANVLNMISSDLANNELSQTSTALQTAIDNFTASGNTSNNAAGLTSTSAAALNTIITSGFTPTGNLADAKIALTNLLRNGGESNYTAFMGYMNMMGDTPEGHLYRAIAELFNVYSSTEVQTLSTDLGISLDTDFTTFDPTQLQTKLMSMSQYGTTIQSLAAAIETQLNAVKTDLNAAEGANIDISLTGFDTVYLDDIDVKILKTITDLATGLCDYIQALNLQVDNWKVDDGTNTGTLVDIRTISSPTDAQIQEFLTNNPNLFKYAASTTKVAAFKTDMTNAVTDYQAAYTALAALSSDQLKNRYQNAFNLDTDLELQSAKAVNDETLPSIVSALSSASQSVKIVDAEPQSSQVIVANDGFAYEQGLFNLYETTVTPTSTAINAKLTLYDLFNGNMTPRDIFNYYMSNTSITAANLYTDTVSTTPYAQNVTETLWDEPIDTYTVPDTTSTPITIDGDASDWTAVPAMIESDQLTVKLARNSAGNVFAYISSPDNLLFGNFYLVLMTPQGQGFAYGGEVNVTYASSGWNAQLYDASRTLTMIGQGGVGSIQAISGSTTGTAAELELPAGSWSALSVKGSYQNYAATLQISASNSSYSIPYDAPGKIKLLPEAQ